MANHQPLGVLTRRGPSELFDQSFFDFDWYGVSSISETGHLGDDISRDVNWLVEVEPAIVIPTDDEFDVSFLRATKAGHKRCVGIAEESDAFDFLYYLSRLFVDKGPFLYFSP